jgi:hypothetical protein
MVTASSMDYIRLINSSQLLVKLLDLREAVCIPARLMKPLKGISMVRERRLL